ncbi:hypothetical protein FHS97_000877 [Sphingomonas endophytica]|uniref:Uncharacterized protein n=1 Tax=Sphingomonas endophytica TaxID=869719 RepID=A0ABR6N2F6_9SPHN|nr:hypothetical protein [Sphingomonas endophytica]
MAVSFLGPFDTGVVVCLSSGPRHDAEKFVPIIEAAG